MAWIGESERERFVRNFFLASIPSLILAFIYSFMGIQLQGNPQYQVIDHYIFSAVTFVSLGVGIPMYYIHHSDLSESLAFAVNILFWLGLGAEDVFVYMFCIPMGKCSYPAHLGWLNDTVYGFLATQVLGFQNVELGFLVIWVVWTGLAVALVNYALYKMEYGQYL